MAHKTSRLTSTSSGQSRVTEKVCAKETVVTMFIVHSRAKVARCV
jgi:hypothetical protein